LLDVWQSFPERGETMEKNLGIDLGATNTCAAIVDQATMQPVVIVNEYGERVTPSVVAFRGDQVLVGRRAKNQAVMNPKGTFYNTKRLIGKRFEEIRETIGFALFPIVADSQRDGAAAIGFDGKIISPQEVSSHILRAVKQSAETQLGEAVKKAVITVPTKFNDAQRQATKDAGQIAGLDVVRIINDSTATAMAYGMGSNRTGTIAVYHLGGATFNVSILNVYDGNFEVLAAHEDLYFGGGNLDDTITNFLLKEIQNQVGFDLRTLDRSSWLSALQRIQIESEKARQVLSSDMDYEISLPYLAIKDGEPINFAYVLTRNVLEGLGQDLVDRTIEPCKKALSDARITASDLDEVILEGGMAHMPLVIDTAKHIFGESPSISVSIKPDEAAALGAAIYAETLAGDEPFAM
jgi:molecular chaperone DnaK